jgi:hypothetical protein
MGENVYYIDMAETHDDGTQTLILFELSYGDAILKKSLLTLMGDLSKSILAQFPKPDDRSQYSHWMRKVEAAEDRNIGPIQVQYESIKPDFYKVYQVGGNTPKVLGESNQIITYNLGDILNEVPTHALALNRYSLE